MKLAITGARGFIGSILASRAKENGHRVVAIDDFSRGLNDYPCIEWDCRKGISHILDEFTYSTKEPPVDAIVHLAAGTGSLSRPYEELCELNVDMTKKIYEEAVKFGVKVFAFPTTSLVEGCPDAPYVKSKQDAMDWLLSQDDGIRVIPLQFYNVTGGYKEFSEIRKMEVHIIPIMIDCYMNDKPFIINGNDYDTIDGTPGRDYSNVLDISDFIIHMIDAQLKSPFKSKGVIKLGTGRITTALQLINMFNRFFKAEVKYEFGPRRAFDCGWLKCDQPYLHAFRTPLPIEQSLFDEVNIILRKVYGEK